MAHIIADRVKETSTTEGTGNFTLGGATTGSVTFNAAMANNDTCDYCIEGLNADGTLNGQWEVGTGTYVDTDTLVRTSVTASSNSGLLVNFSAGTKNVFITLTASKLNQLPTVVSGTFTPIIEGTTTAGTGTYTNQIGNYTKIGNVCTFTILLGITAHTGTGSMKVPNLPFTVGSLPHYATIASSGLTFTGQLVAKVSENTTEIHIQNISSGASEAGVVVDTNFTAFISGSYLTA